MAFDESVEVYRVDRGEGMSDVCACTCIPLENVGIEQNGAVFNFVFN